MFEMPRFRSPHVDAILKRGGIETRGIIEGLVKLNMVTTDIKPAIEGVDLILIVVPAFGVKTMVETCVPHLEDNQTVIFLGRCGGGTLTLAKSMKELGVKKNIIMGETHNLPYLARLMGPGQVKIFLRFYNLFAAAFPAKDTQKIVEPLKKIFPSQNIIPAESVLETILRVSLIHPLLVIFNIIHIELGKEFPMYLEEKFSPSAKRIREAAEREQMTVMRALGIKPRTYPLPSPPDKEAQEKRRKAFQEYCKAPNTPQVRYIIEDIPYGWVTVASIGDMVGVQTPTVDAIITISSIINQVNYWRTGRVAEKLGISGLSVDELQRFMAEGKV